MSTADNSRHLHDWHDTVDSHPTALCKQVAIVGAGSYGTALAIHCARAGHPTTIWCRSPEVIPPASSKQHHAPFSQASFTPYAACAKLQVAEEINSKHTNSKRLPGHECPASLKATTELAPLVAEASLVLLVVPSSHIAATVKHCVTHLRVDAIIVCCAKGRCPEMLSNISAKPLTFQQSPYMLAYEKLK